MTKLLLSTLACFAFVATTSFVFADDANPGTDANNPAQQAPREGEPQPNQQPQ